MIVFKDSQRSATPLREAWGCILFCYTFIFTAIETVRLRVGRLPTPTKGGDVSAAEEIGDAAAAAEYLGQVAQAQAAAGDAAHGEAAVVAGLAAVGGAAVFQLV